MKPKTWVISIFTLLFLVVLGTGIFLNHATQNSKTASTPIRIACVGDSITEGSNYPSELWMLLGANYSVGNFGVGGTTVSLNATSPYMDTSAFQDAKDFEPQIVIIMLGTNDAHPAVQAWNQSFVDNYVALVQSFGALDSKPQIWLVKPPPIFMDGTGLSSQFFDSVVIPDIGQVAERLGLPVIDVYSALAAHPEYFPDGVHPNEAGSRLIAQTVFGAIM